LQNLNSRKFIVAIPARNPDGKISLIRLSTYSNEAQEQLWLNALPNITFTGAQTHDFTLTIGKRINLYRPRLLPGYKVLMVNIIDYGGPMSNDDFFIQTIMSV